MRCRVDGCIHNDDGYCAQPNHVWIESDGTCDQMLVPSTSVEESIDE